MANGPTLRQLRMQEGATGEEAQEFTEIMDRSGRHLTPAEQQRVWEQGIDVYEVPGGSVQLFRGTGATDPQTGRMIPAEDVPLHNLESYIYTGEGPIPDRLRGQIPKDPETGRVMVDEFREGMRSGELVDPRLGGYMADPNLAQTEADLARVKHQDPEKLKGAELEEYNAAVDRLERPPGARPDEAQLPQRIRMQDVDRFMDNLIQTQYGGQDPRLRNIHEEIALLDEPFFRGWYEQNVISVDPDALMWDDLTSAQRRTERAKAKREQFDIRSADKQMKSTAVNNFEQTLRDRAKQQENIEAEMQKLQRKRGEAEVKRRETAARRIPEITADLAKAQQDLTLMEAGGGEIEHTEADIATQRALVRSLTEELARTTAITTGTKRAGEPVRGKKPAPGAAPGEQSLETQIQEAKRRWPNLQTDPEERRQALAWLQEQGVSTESRGAPATTGPSREAMFRREQEDTGGTVLE